MLWRGLLIGILRACWGIGGMAFWRCAEISKDGTRLMRFLKERDC